MTRAGSGGSPPLDSNITRRDFVNGVLAGSGAALLGTSGCARPAAEGAAWTGYGGIGDYARSNGNTWAVVDEAHAIRDGVHERSFDQATQDDELYDVVIVGAGFAGLSAAYEIMRACGHSRRCLILDNHPIFGGEAKQNEFRIRGYRLYAPQGSNDFVRPAPGGHDATLWTELDLPDHFSFAAAPPGVPTAPLDNYGPMYWQAERSRVGYFFRDPAHASGGRWIADPWRDGFASAPIRPELKRDLERLWRSRERPYASPDFAVWLDGMTYKSLLVDVLGLSEAVTAYVDPLLAAADYAFGADVISAYAAFKAWLPGTRGFLPAGAEAMATDELMSFPGGNSAILRHLLKKLLPDAIRGDATFAQILEGPVNFDALDRPGSWLRMRLSSTAVHIRHEPPGSQRAPHAEAAAGTGAEELVSIVYSRERRLHRVRAKSVVMACGGWVARRVLRDMPAPIAAAYREFHHGPMLVVNVGLRNWRFLERLGFTAARWFEGFGFFANIRRPMMVDGRSAPYRPDLPIVMTLYVPLLQPGHDLAAQATLARATLFEKSYRQIEAELIAQMQQLFGGHGFDARRDVGGIILNRWGHAFIAPQPGFLLGRNGEPSPLEVVKRGYGRIFFGHSELAGAQNWPSAVTEGARAARQAMAVI